MSGCSDLLPTVSHKCYSLYTLFPMLVMQVPVVKRKPTFLANMRHGDGNNVRLINDGEVEEMVVVGSQDVKIVFSHSECLLLCLLLPK